MFGYDLAALALDSEVLGRCELGGFRKSVAERDIRPGYFAATLTVRRLRPLRRRLLSTRRPPRGSHAGAEAVGCAYDEGCAVEYVRFTADLLGSRLKLT